MSSFTPPELSQAARPEAIKIALEVFNDPWAFSVLQELFFGAQKFDEFQNNLNISRSVLTRRLRHLEEKKIISRKLYSSRPKRYVYKLTESGIDMYPIFILLRQWSEKWLCEPKQEDIKLKHRHCGNLLRAKVCCEDCGGEITARDVDYQ